MNEYEKLISKQNNKCAICKNPETGKHKNGKIKRLSIDHNHLTGHIRGLLCGKCNTAIGLFNESIDLFHAGIEYLKATNQ